MNLAALELVILVALFVQQKLKHYLEKVLKPLRVQQMKFRPLQRQERYNVYVISAKILKGLFDTTIINKVDCMEGIFMGKT